MKYNPITRRMFLRGTGGTLLSIPFLTSLLPKTASAQAASGPKLRFIMFANEHSPGEIPFFGPTLGGANKTFARQQGNTLISQIGTRPLSDLTSISHILNPFVSRKLTNKISILRSLDIVAGGDDIAHIDAYLGCAAGGDGEEFYSNGSRESVDLMIAKSITGIPELNKHLAIYPQFPMLDSRGNVSNARCYSFKHNSSLGKYERMTGISDPNFLLARLGIEGGAPTAPTPSGISRRDILSKVHEDYQRVMNNSRLSADDRHTLNQYMSMVSLIQRDLASEREITQLACAKPILETEVPYPRPPQLTEKCDQVFRDRHNDRNQCPPDDTYLEWVKADAERLIPQWQAAARAADDIRIRNQMRIVKAALMCDLTRSVSMSFRFDGQGDMDHSTHHAYAHVDNTSGNIFLNSYYENQLRFSTAVAQFMHELDQVAEGQGTMLDNSIVYWNQQYGCSLHEHKGHSMFNMPVVVGGSAGGQLNTGHFIDYRDYAVAGRDRPEFKYNSDWKDYRYEPRGVPINNLLVTFMNCFGMGSSQYEHAAGSGYGRYDHKYGLEGRKFSDTAAKRREPLPFVYKGVKRG